MTAELDPGATDVLRRIGEARPIVQCFASPVSTTFVADALAAVGAAPVMAMGLVEAADFATRRADAVLCNIGSLDGPRRLAMIAAAEAMGAVDRPWVLDPVGVGGTPFRTDVARVLLALGPTVVRANASEFRALAGLGRGPRGTDSEDLAEAATTEAMAIVRGHGAVCVVTGAEDRIVHPNGIETVTGGHALMGQVPGVGCALGGLIAAALAVEPDPVQASRGVLVAWCAAGEDAARAGADVGSFRAAAVDALARRARAALGSA